MRLSHLPPLVLFVLKWTTVGVVGGLVALATILYFNVAGLGQLVQRSSSSWLALYVLGMSFAGLGGPVAVTIAVLLNANFGKRPFNERLERWRAGASASLDEDRPA
jgi:hypothetical protein